MLTSHSNLGTVKQLSLGTQKAVKFQSDKLSPRNATQAPWEKAQVMTQSSHSIQVLEPERRENSKLEEVSEIRPTVPRYSVVDPQHLPSGPVAQRQPKQRSIQGDFYTYAIANKGKKREDLGTSLNDSTGVANNTSLTFKNPQAQRLSSLNNASSSKNLSQPLQQQSLPLNFNYGGEMNGVINSLNEQIHYFRGTQKLQEYKNLELQDESIDLMNKNKRLNQVLGSLNQEVMRSKKTFAKSNSISELINLRKILPSTSPEPQIKLSNPNTLTTAG